MTEFNSEVERWHRDADQLRTRFMTSGADSPESIQQEQVFDELRRIISRELSVVRDLHLVQLTVEIAMSH
ncbi:hypothetical protein [Mycobacterium kiyosense]|uniref:hypothetical protein n=1 Tax=Mycobacterium kiyosense TaxID=2871094 RepID=UPI002231D99A|nr:hypothetical protein [Mycobacterium kiyosense]